MEPERRQDRSLVAAKVGDGLSIHVETIIGRSIDVNAGQTGTALQFGLPDRAKAIHAGLI